MSLTRSLLVVVFVGSLILPVSAQGDEAQQAYERGKALVRQADFRAALQAFAAAARADRTNGEYLQQFTLVRQVIKIQDTLETDSPRWEYLARALHTYYIDEQLYDQALELDQRIHERVNNASSAALLAETQLAMNLNSEAAEVLSKLPPDKANIVTESLEGIALARLGRKADAVKHAESIQLTDGHEPGIFYCVARLQAATGNVSEAATLLSRCFEQTPPSRLEDFKKHAQMTPEFTALVGTPEFEKSLKTESKVKESSCSGGSSCAGCPMRGKCNQGQ